MKKQALATQRRTTSKTPTTAAVVAKVQRITAVKDGGRQAPWTSNLQRVVDTRSNRLPRVETPPHPAKQRASQPSATDSNPDRDNRANQLNPDHEQYWKSRGLTGRPQARESGNGQPAPAPADRRPRVPIGPRSSK